MRGLHAVCGLLAATSLAGGFACPALAQTGSSPADNNAYSGLEDIVVTARKTAESSQKVPIAITAVTSQKLTDLSVRDVIEVQKVTPGLFISSQGTGGRAKIAIRGQSEADSKLTTDGSVGVYIDGVNLARSYGLRAALVDIDRIEVLKGPQGTLFGKNTTGGALNITTKHPVYDTEGYVDLAYGNYNNLQALAVVNLPLIQDKLAIRVVGQQLKRDGFGKNFGSGLDSNDDNTITGRIHVRADPTDKVSILLSADYVRQRAVGANTIITNDTMLSTTAGNRPAGALGAIAAELGLNPNLAADRMTAYNRWRTYYDRYASGEIFYDSFSGDRNIDNFKHWGLSATIDVDFGSVSFRSITAYRKLSRENALDLDGTPFLLQVSYLTMNASNFSQELQLNSIDGQGLDWQLGGYYNREVGNEFSNSNPLVYANTTRSAVLDDDSVNASKAAYAQATYNFSSKFRVTGGIRYTSDLRELVSHNRVEPALAVPPKPSASVARCNLLTPALGGPVFPNCTYGVSTTFNAFTYLFSVDYQPTPDVMLYASTSRGYRAGGYTAAAASTLQTSLDQLNASFTPFKPETVTNYEVGIKSDLLDRRLRVNAALFYQKYRDIQVQIRDIVGANTVTLIRNAARANPYGAEIEITAIPVEGLTLSAGGSYLHTKYEEFKARDTAGNLVDRSTEPFSVPKWAFDLGATYVIRLTDGSVRLNTSYSWRDDVNLKPDTPDRASVTQPAYGLLDARISWDIASQGLNIALFGKNLTNKRYIIAATNLQGQGWNVAFTGDPRIYGIQIRKTF